MTRHQKILVAVISAYFGVLMGIVTQPALAGGVGQIVAVVNQLMGAPLSGTRPTNGQVLTYNSTTGRWAPASAAGGGETLAQTLALGADANSVPITGLQTLSFAATAPSQGHIGGPSGATFEILGWSGGAGVAGKSLNLGGGYSDDFSGGEPARLLLGSGGLTDGGACVIDGGDSLDASGATLRVQGGVGATPGYIEFSTDSATRLKIGSDGILRGVPSKHPDAPPITANAFDDEFDDSTVDASWTTVSASAATLTEANGCLKIVQAANQVAAAIGKDPGSTYTITAKVSLLPTTWANYAAAGLMVRDSASGKHYEFFITHNVSAKISVYRFTGGFDQVTHYTSTAAEFAMSATAGTGFFAPIYLRVVQDGTNISFQWSPDGQAFREIFAEGRTAFLTSIANQIGPMMSSFTTACQGHFDWIRKQ
jgi:hypothetical protein